MRAALVAAFSLASVSSIVCSSAVAQEPTWEETTNWIESNMRSKGCNNPLYSNEVNEFEARMDNTTNLRVSGVGRSHFRISEYGIDSYYNLKTLSTYWNSFWKETQYNSDIHKLTFRQSIDDLSKITGFTKIAKIQGCYVFEIMTSSNDVNYLLWRPEQVDIKRKRDRLRVHMADREMAERMKKAVQHAVKLAKQAAQDRRNAEPF